MIRGTKVVLSASAQIGKINIQLTQTQGPSDSNLLMTKMEDADRSTFKVAVSNLIGMQKVGSASFNIFIRDIPASGVGNVLQAMDELVKCSHISEEAVKFHAAQKTIQPYGWFVKVAFKEDSSFARKSYPF